jgi:hypothetical protein
VPYDDTPFKTPLTVDCKSLKVGDRPDPARALHRLPIIIIIIIITTNIYQGFLRVFVCWCVCVCVCVGLGLVLFLVVIEPDTAEFFFFFLNMLFIIFNLRFILDSRLWQLCMIVLAV